MIKKLQALEQAFGEALPWSKAMKLGDTLGIFFKKFVGYCIS